MFPTEQRALHYSRDLFYVEDAVLNSLNLSNGKKEVIVEFLKTPQLSDVVRTTRFELRPISNYQFFFILSQK